MDLAELYFTVRKLRAFVDESLGGPGGGSIPLYGQAVLRAVLEDPGMTMGQAADRAAIAQSLVSRFVPGAVETGLLRTETDDNDRRLVRLYPGDRLVSQFAGQLAADAASVLAPLLDQMPAQDRAALLRSLESLHQVFKARSRTPEAGRSQLLPAPERNSKPQPR